MKPCVLFLHDFAYAAYASMYMIGCLYARIDSDASITLIPVEALHVHFVDWLQGTEGLQKEVHTSR